MNRLLVPTVRAALRVRRPRGRRVAAVLTCVAMFASGAAPAAAQPTGVTSTTSDLRIGVLALADAIAAVGRTPELAEPLPFTRTSVADALDLDQSLIENLTAALAGTDLQAGLNALDGVTATVDTATNEISFTYSRTATVPLELAYDDGALRFGPNSGAGDLTVTLETPTDGTPFVVRVDDTQDDPLLRFALVSEPELQLTVDIDNEAVTAFPARQGFTEIDVTGGSYTIDRDALITLRDPNGRGILTLEDLRYSTLVDLYRIVPGTDVVDIDFGVRLGNEIGLSSSGTEADRTGTLALDQDAPGDVWPDPAQATRSYGDALTALTGLSLVDGVSALAEYTGVALALQDAADVDFPNLAGSVTDLFAPADDLLDLLATSAVAQIRCGVTPASPPAGIAAPGDTVYCDAVTADGLGAPDSVTWAVDSGTIVTTDTAEQEAAVGAAPSGTVRIDGTDGEPDVTVALNYTDAPDMVARSMPRTIQDVTSRVTALGTGASSSAEVNLTDGRLDVAVAITESSTSTSLGVGDPASVGALVGLTGMDTPEGGGATATATDASFDVGFGLPTGPDVDRTIVLLPANDSLIEIDDLSVAAPSGLTDLPGRIGFLGVEVDVTGLTLANAVPADPVVSLDRTGTGALALNDVLNDDGALRPDKLSLSSHLTASLAFAATELPLTVGGTDYASGGSGGVTGAASVEWDDTGFPRAVFGTGYDDLRVFDPVPATFLTGTAAVTGGTGDEVVAITVTGTSLFTELGVPATDGIEVARRLVAPGVSCQNVTLTNSATLTCAGLAPQGEAAFATGDPVELIILGDPFALRDGIIEGLAGTLNSFQRLDRDNIDDSIVDDQYASTLAMVDLTPSQLAVERDALADALADLVLAATEDEAGTSGGLASVSSAQEFSTVATGFVGTGSTLTYTLGTELGVDLSATAPTGTTLDAPLRFFVDGTGQTVSDFDITVGVGSSTTLAIAMDVATARPRIAANTATSSTATFDAAGLTGALMAGAGELTVTDGTADLDLTVATTFNATDELLTTVRTTTDSSDVAASADLVVTERPDDNLVYTGGPTDSSGGTGAAQPAPEPMQVAFLAEGLDGLATALGSALDGAAPRNTGPEGAPIAAPLIGSDLDAGAGVADLLTGLTSALRDELAGIDVDGVSDDDPADDVDDAAALETALVTAVTKAVADAPSVTGADVSATVTCDDATCDDPDDGPTDWDKASISVTLTGDEKTDGEIPFSVGLDGLAVRSDLMVATTTSWTLPVTLDLVRGVGPQVTIGTDDVLSLAVSAQLPARADVDTSVFGGTVTGETCTTAAARCLPAIVGYLPAMLTTTDDAGGSMSATVEVTPDVAASYDLFDLYDGLLAATPGFADDAGAETGLSLDFETVVSTFGSFDLMGTVDVPWTAADGFGTVEYKDVQMDVGEVIATIATPFAVVDPYLGPARDVVDVLRTPIPVISDLSKLGGGEAISLLSILRDLQGGDAKLDLAVRIIGYIETAVDISEAIAPFAQQNVPLEELAASGALLTVEPSTVALASSCSQTVRTSTTTGGGDETTPTTKHTKSKAKCPPPGTTSQNKAGARGQTTDEQRRGTRNTKQSVGTTTKGITGSAPGFSLPFLADPDQIVDVLTGEGEATYFRLDFGTLQAQVAYTRKFGPIMAGPVPIVPFVGGSITVEGRLAVGFDSMPQTLAARSLSNPGDVAGLITAYKAFSDEDILREGFYLDDLDASGIDVPEVKLITTLEAGASVSIGIVSAGLAGGVTLTINLDLNDPNNDGKIRVAEIRDDFAGNTDCIFDASATIEAFIRLFFEIELFVTTKKWSFDLLRLGPYTLFEYGCKDQIPTLVVEDTGDLALTSGTRDDQRNLSSFEGIAEDYEVRQFDTDGGAATAGGKTVYEVSALNRVQRVQVTAGATSGYDVKIFEVAFAISATPQKTFNVASLSDLRFLADGGAEDDRLSFLLGETYVDGALVSTPFTTPVTANGGAGHDMIVTGDADDIVHGNAGNDSISLNLGDDVATGGAGNDNIDGGAGTDDIDGGADNDRLEGGPGPDRLIGGAGDDALVGGPGRDVRAVLLAGVGETVDTQVALGFDSGDVLVGGAGTDIVDGGDGSDVVVGGDAPLLTDPTPLTDPSFASLFTTGSRMVNVLTKGDTNPVPTTVDNIPTAAVPSVSELDTLCRSGTALPAGSGGDTVTGGPELDIVIGGNGPDDLDGGAGPDEICGRAGDDRLSGDGAALPGREADSDNDIIRGGHGNDRIDAGAGDDVVFGDDVDLVRTGGTRVLDGTLGSNASGAGDDYLAGDVGDDVLAGGAGSDLVIGGDGDDATYGEGADTVAVGGDRPSLADRLVSCQPVTRVVAGYIDLNGDLLAGSGGDGITSDDGRIAGLAVLGGKVLTLGSTDNFTGLVNGELVFLEGLHDLDRDGDIDANDTGTIDLPSMLATTSTNTDGDCILSGDGDDLLRGGAGSDYLGAGDGIDLVDGGDGNDLLLGDAGTDVILGGPHDDVLVGGDGDDHLLGGQGDDRLRGNRGDDDLVGGSDATGLVDGQDVLLGGRGEDVLAGENAVLVSDSIVAEVALAAWTQSTAPSFVPTTVLAGTDSDLRFDNSALTCDGGSPTRWLELLAGGDETRTPLASPGGPVLYDELFGGFGCDWVFGQEGDDLVRGGQDDDVVEGGPGADVVHGDDGDDLAIGGSSTDGAVTLTRTGTGISDGVDIVHGDAGVDDLDGDDIVVGDNARLDPEPATGGVDRERWPTIRPGVSVQLFDVDAKDADIAALSGGDTLTGGGGDDLLLGQHGNDTIRGGAGDDAVEGNAGADIITGDTGHDALVGGGSTLDGDVGTGSVGDGLSDGIDHISGGAGDDVITGDNARVQAEDELRADGTVLRTIRLYDVETSGVDPAGAGDQLTGGTGRDLLFGQGGADTISGGDDDDVLEGNAGDDTLYGGGGEDDLIGGGSTTNGLVITKVAMLVSDRLLQPVAGTVDASAAGMHDGDDVLYGGDGPVSAGGQADGADVLLGDNGRITRDGTTIAGGGSGVHDVRQVAMADEAAGPTSGSDLLVGQAGDDDLYGQFDDTDDDVDVGGGQSFQSLLVEGDVLLGGPGDDALIGDQGVDVPTPAADLGKPDTLTDKTKFVSEPVRQRGTLIRVVTLTQPTLGGDDVLLGGAGRDAIHAGAGADLANGGDDDDVLFGGNGSDALWGGPDHDILFGGDGADFLDIKKRVDESPLWVAVAPDVDTDGRRATVNGMDTTYGGLGPDAAQADVGDQGRTNGDRLIDWTGVFNLYLVCDGAYGAGKVQNRPSPGMAELLVELARSWGSVGGGELALVESGDTTPKYPGAPGNFTCEEG